MRLLATATTALCLLSADAIADPAGKYDVSGTVAAVARSSEDFGALTQSREWELAAPDPKQWVWTDDYSNVLGSVLRKLRE